MAATLRDRRRPNIAHRAPSDPASIRHRLAALSSLFEYLCEKNTVTHNPVKGVKRPPVEATKARPRRWGTTRRSRCWTRRSVTPSRPSAIAPCWPPLLYHALRREELCKLSVKDFRHERRGVAHLKVFGKGSKTRYVPLHPAASGLIVDYL